MRLAIRAFSTLGIAALSVLAAIACGPPKPVLIFTPPSVELDSTRAPRRSAAVKSASHTFWEAMANLDTAFISRHEVSESQKEFARALGLVMLGRHADAALALDGVRTTARDSVLISAARVLMTAMLQHQDEWKLLAELDSMGRRNSGVDGTLDRAGVESWSTAFRKVPQRETVFPAQPVVLPLMLSASGTPMVEITIDGKRRTFWLDTGSSLSIVSTDIAAELGMKPLLPDTLEVATTTGRVPAQAGAIRHLQIGGISIRNIPSLIVSSNRMQVRVGDEVGSPVAAQIEGVIGFDIISRLDVRIDYVNNRVTLQRPALNARPPRTGRNLFWVGTPVVRLVTSKGVPLHFNLDTGAQETYSTDGLLMKTKPRVIRGERRLVGGFAGVKIVHGRFVDELRATMGGQALVLRKLMVFAPAFSSFVTLDGILGSDVGKTGVVRIDATNGVFQLEPAPSRGLRTRS